VTVCALFGSDLLGGISKVEIDGDEYTINAKNVLPRGEKIVLKVYSGFVRPGINNAEAGVEVGEFSGNREAIRGVLEKVVDNSNITQSVVDEIHFDLTS